MVYQNIVTNAGITPQTHHVYSTSKRYGNGHFHVVSTWNTRGVFVGKAVSILDLVTINPNLCKYENVLSLFQNK